MRSHNLIRMLDKPDLKERDTYILENIYLLQAGFTLAFFERLGTGRVKFKLILSNTTGNPQLLIRAEVRSTHLSR